MELDPLASQLRFVAHLVPHRETHQHSIPLAKRHQAVYTQHWVNREQGGCDEGREQDAGQLCVAVRVRRACGLRRGEPLSHVYSAIILVRSPSCASVVS